MNSNHKTHPLISIIIPAKNAESFIAQCLQSILDQNYQNLEILLIDDGSTDRTVEIALSFTDSRLIVLSGNSHGVSHARNVGISAAGGEYIMFVDADDALEPGTIAEGVAVSQSANLDIVIGGIKKVWSPDNYIVFAIDSPSTEIYTENEIDALIEAAVGYKSDSDPRLNSCHLTGSWSKLITARLLHNIRFNESLVIGEDTVFNVELLKSSQRVGVVPHIWYIYYQNSYSATKRYRPNALKESGDTLSALHRLLDKRFAKSYDRRVLSQLGGALELVLLGKCPESKQSVKAATIQRELNSSFWATTFDTVRPSNGLRLNHRLLFFLARHHHYRCLCFAIKLKELIKFVMRFNLVSNK